jgi:hypothetical protein
VAGTAFAGLTLRFAGVVKYLRIAELEPAALDFWLD